MNSLNAIQKLQQCSQEDADRVLARLRQDSGAGPAFAAALAEQKATLWAGIVMGTGAIGALNTIWTELAGVQARERHARPCFRVHEALEVLRDPVVPRKKQPKDDLGTILAMIEAIERGAFTPQSVLANSDAGLYIVDGNKSAVAVYEHAHRRHIQEAVLPVIIPYLPDKI